MSSTSSSSDIDYFKIIATGASAAAIDMFVFGENNINNTGVIAVSAAGGAWIGSMVGTSLPDLSSSLPVFLGNGKGLMQRAIEIGSGVGAGYAINKFVLKSGGYRENITNKLITFAAADIIGEYASDFINNRPLSILS
jgi:hypothetical protein